MSSDLPASPQTPKKKQHPFRRAILRGLALVMPPLLTIVLFIWAWKMIESYVLLPLETGARTVIVWSISDVYDRVPPHVETELRNGQRAFQHRGTTYVQLDRRNQWIPAHVYDNVEAHPDIWPADQPPPQTANAYYHQYVRNVWLPRQYVIPIFLIIFVTFLYVLGKFVAAGVGRILWNMFEGLIHRLPLIRNVYSSVKQVTDFIFVEKDIEFTRVVAVEYPRKGIWSIGFATGDSMLDISSAANEPVLSVLMPTSPAPMTGFTITVRRSEAIDLNISVDQALQFIVSCGVVVPPQQRHCNNRVVAELSAAVARSNMPPAAEHELSPAPAGEKDDPPGHSNHPPKERS